jgi:hypothetical protein
MTRRGAFLWSALVAFVCSTVVSFPFGLDDLEMRSVAIGVGFIFLLAISWAVAGIVSISKAPPRTLMIVSVAVSIMVSVGVIVKLLIDFSHP